MHVHVRTCMRVCVHACVHVLLEQRDRAVKACQDQSTLVLQLSAERDELDVQLASARTEVGDNGLSKI